MQAALGLSQLDRAKAGVDRRRQLADNYNKAFAGLKIKTPFLDERFHHAYHLYVVQVDNRKGLYEYLKENGIYSQVHYIPVHLQPYYGQFGWKKNDFPIAEKYYGENVLVCRCFLL